MTKNTFTKLRNTTSESGLRTETASITEFAKRATAEKKRLAISANPPVPKRRNAAFAARKKASRKVTYTEISRRTATERIKKYVPLAATK